MTLTRAQGVAALQHVLHNVMALPNDSPIEKALLADGRDDICDVVVMNDTEIAALSYTDDQGVVSHLNGGQKGLL